MRNDSRDIRIAITTLYVRMRNARRHREDLFTRFGSTSIAYQAADAEYVATHNALQAVKENIQTDRPTTSGADFRRMVILAARSRQRHAKAA